VPAARPSTSWSTWPPRRASAWRRRCTSPSALTSA
jgi:hypothetical protein